MGSDGLDVEPLTKTDLAAISTDQLHPIMATVFPNYEKLTPPEQHQLKKYLTRYLAYRRKTHSVHENHRKIASNAARKGLSSDVDLESILAKQYGETQLPPRQEFLIDIERIKIRYDSKMTPDSYATEQFNRLRNALLDIAAIKPHPLDVTRLSVSRFVSPPDTVDSKRDAQRLRSEISSLLSDGFEALAAAEKPLTLDVTPPTNTQFGETWQIAKTITGKYLSLNQDLSTDSVTIGGSNTTDNLQLVAQDKNPVSQECVVELKLHYFLTGRFDITATAFPTMAIEGVAAQWSIEYRPKSTRKKNIKPLIRERIRCYKQTSRMLHNLDSIDSQELPWTNLE